MHMEAQSEDALRVYIRERLLDYALTHLTVDYISFTENAVIDVLTNSLVKVRTTDPHSLALPLDPFEALFRSYKLNELSQYEEKWTADEESLNCVRRVVAVSGERSTDRWWLEETNRDFDTSYATWRTLSPLLTTRARRTTRMLGFKQYLQRLPQAYSDVVNSTLPAKVEHHQEIDQPPNVKLDDVLDVKTVLDVETHTQMVSLLKSVTFRPDATYMNKCIETFLHVPDPLPSPPYSESCFIPIFPQRRTIGIASSLVKSSTGLKDFAGVTSLCLPVQIEDNVWDLHEEHMDVVDGWQTVTSLPSSVSTPTPSQLDQDLEIDELFMHSSPSTELTPIQVLVNAKLDEIEVPRTRRLGGIVEKPECIRNGQSLASFILPRIPAPQEPALAAPLLPQSHDPSISLVGQATSVNEDDAHPSCLGKDLTEDFDVIVSRVYACVRGHGPEDPIMSENLEERDGQLLDVPNLPAPNLHIETRLWLPASLSSLVYIPQGKYQDPQTITMNIGQNRWFQKAKGSHSLSMTLSWIPFRSNMKGVTHDHGAGVLKFGGGFLGECDADDARVEKLLEQVIGDDPTHVQRSDSMWLKAGDGEYQTKLPGFSYAADGSELALTREERWRSCGSIKAHPDPMDELDLHQNHHEEAVYAGKQRNTDSSRAHVSDMSQNPASGVIPCDDYFTLDHSDAPLVPGHHDTSRWRPRESFEYPPSPAREMIENTIFSPLSFESQRDASSQVWPPTDIAEGVPDPFFDLLRGSTPAETLSAQEIPEKSVGKTTPSRSPINSNAELACAVVEFARLRSRTVPEPTVQSIDGQVLPIVQRTADNFSSGVPAELIDGRTICLEWPQPIRTHIHRYLASMDVIQKQSLVRAFRAEQCLVDLIERDTLGGVDIVVDPSTAIIFSSLHALPSQCDALVTNLGLQSWRYSHLLVVLEAYPERQSYGPSGTKLSAMKLASYTPPNIKAVKKMRRDLSIAEGFGTKSTACNVYVSFANNVDEAAFIIRSFGEYAEANDDKQGALWGTREWLDFTPHEGEQDLALVDGMNTFAAIVILCQISLRDFLDATAEYRLNEFGSLIGVHRVNSLNRLLEDRYLIMESMMSSETIKDPNDSPG